MNRQVLGALQTRYVEAVMRVNACLANASEVDDLLGQFANGSLVAQVLELESYIEDNCRFSFETFWPLHTRIIMTFIFATLSLIGIVGNLLVILVVFRVRGMSTPTNCYLVSLAVSDTLFFIAAAPTEISFLHTPTNYYVFGQVGCALFSYLPFLAINTSSLSITAFTIERYIGICHPMRARYMCTVKRARIIISCIWIFCLTYNSPWLYLATLKAISFIDLSGYACGFKLERSNWSYKVIFLGDFAAFYLIPMCLYVFLYTRIAFTLKASRNLTVTPTPKPSLTSSPLKRFSRGASQTSTTLDVSYATTGAKDSDPELNRRFSVPESSNRLNSLESNGDSLNPDRSVIRTNNQMHPKISLQIPTRSTSMMATIANARGSRDTFVSGGRKTSSKGRNQVVKMLAVIVAVFAICWLPYRAMVMYNSFATSKWDPDWYIMLSKTMIFINCAINPICYNLMSGRFRNAFRQLLKSGGKIPYRNGTVRSSNITRQPMTTETKIYVSNYDIDDSCNPSESEKDTLLLTSLNKATMAELLPSPLARRQDSEPTNQETKDESHV